MQVYRFHSILQPLKRHFVGQPMRTIFFRRPPRIPTPWSGTPDLELHFREMARHFEQLEREVNSAWAQRRTILPTVFANRTSSPMSMYESEIDGKYQMNIYMGHGFSPENIKVTLKDRVLTVEAKCDQTSDDGQARVYQECTQKFTLPGHLDPLKVTSKFTPEGVLQIEGPLPPEPEGEKAKEIPINIESSK